MVKLEDYLLQNRLFCHLLTAEVEATAGLSPDVPTLEFDSVLEWLMGALMNDYLYLW